MMQKILMMFFYTYSAGGHACLPIVLSSARTALMSVRSLDFYIKAPIIILKYYKVRINCNLLVI